MVENEAGSNTVNVGNAAGVIGFYAVTPVARQAVVSNSADGVYAALVNLGLISTP